MRLMNQDGPQVSEENLFPEERAIRQLTSQENQDLQMLAALPKNSELYNAKL